jgi:RNA polymerase sigma-70 factor (ECF subfamily)
MNSESTTRQTIERVLAGDRNAYADLIDQHFDMLTAFAAYRLPSRELVDEVVQQTLIRAFEQLAEFEPGGDFGVWLRVICKYMIMAELKRQVQANRNSEKHRDRIRARLAQAAIDTEDRVDDDVRTRLDRCLEHLDAESRRLLEARYQRAVPVLQIAEQFERTESWVKTNLFRVRQALRLCMEGGA